MPELTLPQKHSLAAERHLADMEAWDDQVVPDPDAPAVQALLAELGAGPAELVALRDIETGIYGWALDGVQAKTDLEGGTMRVGWRLRAWANVLLIAEFHAVWADQDGVSVDITPVLTKERHSLFAPIAAAPEDLDWDNLPATQYRMLHIPVDIAPLIAPRIAALKPSQRAYEERRAAKAGQTLEEWIAGKFEPDPVPDAVAAVVAACEAFEAKLPALNERMEARPDDFDEEDEGPWLVDYETEEARDTMYRWNNARIRACDALYDAVHPRQG
jgi:hypothetical protein